MKKRTMLRHLNLVLMILACIVIVASCASGPLLMDQIFQAEMLVENRDTNEKHVVFVNKINDNIMARIESQAYPTALYKNGYLQIGNECVNNIDSIAPMLPLTQTPDGFSLEHFWTHLLVWNETIPLGATGFDASVNQCKDKKRYVLEYEDEHFILCAENNEQEDTSILASTTFIISQNLHITLKYRKNSIDNNLLRATNNLEKKCQVSNSITATNNNHLLLKHSMRKLWFNSPSTCSLLHIMDKSTCSQVVTTEVEKKVCIFLHGSGESDVGEPISMHKNYWGNVHKYTPQCKERIFIREDTLHRGWNNQELQESYCRVALTGQPSDEKLIKNKIIFAHSMGNLILAGAIMNGVCDIDNTTTSWYAIQAPIKGSKAATFLETICAIGQTMTSKAYNLIASRGGYCINNKSAAVYETLSPTFPQIDRVYDIMKARVKGALCGSSAVGLWTVYSLVLEALSAVVDYQDTNDGMVASTSCLLKGSDYAEDDYQSQYYHAKINHSDGPCRNGDGVYSKARKPCSWFLWKM